MRKPLATFHILDHYVESEMLERGRNPMSVHHLKATNQAVKWKVTNKPYGGKRQALTQWPPPLRFRPVAQAGT